MNYTDVLPLLLKAAFKSTNQDSVSEEQITLPDNTQKSVDMVSPDQANRFHQLVNWPNSEIAGVHPCLIHVLAFPLHLRLMLQADFPFAMIGLVHTRNQIEQFAAIQVGQPVHLQARFQDIVRQDKGWEFSICTQALVEQKLVWQSVSTNLFLVRNKKRLRVASDFDRNDWQANQCWQLSEKLGWRYARASGDFNLIHLHPWLARLFGFRRNIAHGMWTKSRCISALLTERPPVFRCEVDFRKAVNLPARVQFAQHNAFPNQFALLDANGANCLLKGNIETQ